MVRKGTNGVSTNGSLQMLCFFVDRDMFWVRPLTCLYLPKRTRAYLFPRSVNTYYFCSGPISVDPICLQPSIGSRKPLNSDKDLTRLGPICDLRVSFVRTLVRRENCPCDV